MKVFIFLMISINVFAYNIEDDITPDEMDIVLAQNIHGYTHLLQQKDAKFLISETCVEGCDALKQIKKLLKTRKKDDFFYPNGKNPGVKICLDEFDGTILPAMIHRDTSKEKIMLCEFKDKSVVSIDSIFYWISFLQ